MPSHKKLLNDILGHTCPEKVFSNNVELVGTHAEYKIETHCVTWYIEAEITEVSDEEIEYAIVGVRKVNR